MRCVENTGIIELRRALGRAAFQFSARFGRHIGWRILARGNYVTLRFGIDKFVLMLILPMSDGDRQSVETAKGNFMKVFQIGFKNAERASYILLLKLLVIRRCTVKKTK